MIYKTTKDIISTSILPTTDCEENRRRVHHQEHPFSAQGQRGSEQGGGAGGVHRGGVRAPRPPQPAPAQDAQEEGEGVGGRVAGGGGRRDTHIRGEFVNSFGSVFFITKCQQNILKRLIITFICIS